MNFITNKRDLICKVAVGAGSLMAVSFLLIRFFAPGLASFINDEPNLQLIITRSLAKGSLPYLGLSGSQPIPYGPTPAWIYAFLRLISDNFYFMWNCHLIAQVASFLIVARVLVRRYKLKNALLPVLLMTLSPFLFYYSRLLWDNTWLIVFSSLILLACDFAESSANEKHVLALSGIMGALGGLCISTHLLTIPFVVVSTLFVAITVKSRCDLKSKKILSALAVGLFAGILTLTPYFIGLSTLDIRAMLISGAGSVGSLKKIEVLRAAFKMPSVLIDPDFFKTYILSGILPVAKELWISPMHFENAISGLGQHALKLFPYVIFIPWFANFLKMNISGQSWRFEKWLGFGAPALTFLLQSWKRIDQHPHYYHFLWWCPILVLGAILSRAAIPITRIVKIWLLALVCLNAVGLYRVIESVTINEGARGFGYGMAVQNQQKIIHFVCSTMASKSASHAVIGISSVRVLPPSLEYFVSQDPACQGRSIAFAANGEYELSYDHLSSTAARVLINGQTL